MSSVIRSSSLPPKAVREKLLTIYGRKPVLEALSRNDLNIFRLHLASTNKSAEILTEIINLANQRNIEISYHSRIELSRISKTARQDQGVALDLIHEGFYSMSEFLKERQDESYNLLALDNITNPQNIGMIIRSVAASGIHGVIIPQQGCAKLDPLVIKASAGALFKCTIIRCKNLSEIINTEITKDTDICILDSSAKKSVFDYSPGKNAIFVLGNESKGVSSEIKNTGKIKLYIPMNNNIESLNVAAAATIVSYYLSIKT